MDNTLSFGVYSRLTPSPVSGSMSNKHLATGIIQHINLATHPRHEQNTDID